MDTAPAVPADQSRRRMSYLFFGLGVVLFVLAYFIGVSDNPPGIISLILGMFLIVLAIAYRVGKPAGRKPAQELLYWSPRVLCIAFAFFTCIFALDVFGEGRGFWDVALALFMHLIPTFLIVILLVVSWRREWIGGYLFIVLAALYVVTSLGKPFAVWWALLLMAGPLALVGVLFLINWYNRGTLRGSST